jgi:hypothetical protein
VGTEFKVMQELMRHSSLRSTMDLYTQAVTPAKREAQAAVLSLLFPPGMGQEFAENKRIETERVGLSKASKLLKRLGVPKH